MLQIWQSVNLPDYLHKEPTMSTKRNSPNNKKPNLDSTIGPESDPRENEDVDPRVVEDFNDNLRAADDADLAIMDYNPTNLDVPEGLDPNYEYRWCRYQFRGNPDNGNIYSKSIKKGWDIVPADDVVDSGRFPKLNMGGGIGNAFEINGNVLCRMPKNKYKGMTNYYEKADVEAISEANVAKHNIGMNATTQKYFEQGEDTNVWD